MVGARTEVVSAAAHDQRLGWASHLPQSVSSALALALDARGIAPADLGPGGRDATRLAGSDPRLWADVALDNAETLIAAIEGTEAQLASLRAALAANDHSAVYAFFAAGRRWAGAGGAEQ
jgi:prephenate dehydrogenase